MPVSMAALADDLAAETAVLRALVADLDEGGWARPTPAPGWTISDQLAHLAYFDDIAVQSALEPTAFEDMLASVAAAGGIDAEAIAEQFRDMPGARVLVWFDRSRYRLLATFRGLDSGRRLPWFGPTMSAASSLTARIMETWAHGQDVADTVGVRRTPTDRLYHVAHIGVGARAYSYTVHGREVPTSPIRVELTAPGGALWGWGPEDAADRVTGPALDFCLAVTQRRHRADTAVSITGPVATEWMSIAQAFAGPAGTGRPAAQAWNPDDHEDSGRVDTAFPGESDHTTS